MAFLLIDLFFPLNRRMQVGFTWPKIQKVNRKLKGSYPKKIIMAHPTQIRGRPVVDIRWFKPCPTKSFNRATRMLTRTRIQVWHYRKRVWCSKSYLIPWSNHLTEAAVFLFSGLHFAAFSRSFKPERTCGPDSASVINTNHIVASTSKRKRTTDT